MDEATKRKLDKLDTLAESVSIRCKSIRSQVRALRYKWRICKLEFLLIEAQEYLRPHVATDEEDLHSRIDEELAKGERDG